MPDFFPGFERRRVETLGAGINPVVGGGPEAFGEYPGDLDALRGFFTG